MSISKIAEIFSMTFAEAMEEPIYLYGLALAIFLFALLESLDSSQEAKQKKFKKFSRVFV